MNKLLSLSFIIGLFFSLNVNATNHSIVTVGQTYSPSELTVLVGDTVTFTIGANHPTVEVSEDTWNANMATPLVDGFGSFSSEFSIIITDEMAPIIYYVCINHIAGGMKGLINVMPLGVEEIVNEIDFRISPNPIQNQQLNYTIGVAGFESGNVNIYDIKGQLVKSHNLRDLNGTIQLNIVPGNYFMQLRNEKGELMVSERLIVL